jgi:hypothetical protein
MISSAHCLITAGRTTTASTKTSALNAHRKFWFGTEVVVVGGIYVYEFLRFHATTERLDGAL